MGRRLTLFLDTPILAKFLAQVIGPLERPDVRLRTGILNAYELVHLLVRAGRRGGAREAYARVEPLIESLSRDRIFAASEVRTRHADRGLSYADAAGYATAQELGAVFVTSDRAFSGMPGVRLETAETSGTAGA